MPFGKSRFKRVIDDSGLGNLPTTQQNHAMVNPKRFGRNSRVLSRVFSEDYEKTRTRSVMDPRSRGARRWNRVFLAACLLSLVVDPLFFFLQEITPEMCVETSVPFQIVLTVLRSLVDCFYVINIIVHFRTAFVAPSSRVFGRGELIIDLWKIAKQYLNKGFWIDLMAALPIPQVMFWAVLPNLKGPTISNTNAAIRFIILIQYMQRLFMAYPLSMKIAKATGIVTATAWVGAAYNLMFYMLGSHVVGGTWYLLSIEREEACWRSVCDQENSISCTYSYFDCSTINDPNRTAWFLSSNVTTDCNPINTYYQWGIYGPAAQFGITSGLFFNKFFSCLWFGLRNLSSTGQNLSTSIDIGENIYSCLIATVGLILLALLIGNMQMYIMSATARLEEWRLRRADTEQWMHHRQLPQELRQYVRKYDQYKWVATQGVDEEAILKDLPTDLRRQIKRHLCLNLVRRVALFDHMDDRMLDSICERLKPTLCTKDTFLEREGDPVTEMLFIIRGHLDSYTTNGGRTGFFNSCWIGPGDFCGEELLTWALHPHPNGILPSSTRTVKAISDVEAFALVAEDIKFVASQFRRLHSKQIRHKFRFHSHQWQTWAACYIQAAWRRYKKRKELAELHLKEHKGLGSFMDLGVNGEEVSGSQSRSGLAWYAARLRMSTRSSGFGSDSGLMSPQPKPAEPDFYED
ncbi:protein CNGC15b-like [Rhododendron vialii]|uniref:protein CNGC15b-like n=1 Tax=Rhododendron vialii TaxID=182163 RepID=UPI00265ED6FD|nr:protein CNGC15b-like [Rhododendron vialii]